MKTVNVPSKSGEWGDEYKKLERDMVMGDLRGDRYGVQGVDLINTHTIYACNSQRINLNLKNP